jgi:predicted transglutaminase-like protease
MNIKQSLSTIDEVLTSAIGHFQGYCPTSDEIENDKVKSLANRLKAESYKETLTNVLEWQEKNVVFWTERQPILPLLMYIYLIFVAGTAIFFSAAFIVSTFLLIVLNSQTMLAWFFQIATWFIQNLWWSIAILASCTMTILATMISILHSNRKFPWKEVPRALKNVFWSSISMNFLLENKLGVCRDYAKMTACLLSNIYPNAEIYFATAPAHVAAGINIQNRLYMLDQRLPILTKDRWNDYRKPKKLDRIERFDPIKKTLRKADKTAFLQTKSKSELNTENLAERMTKLLNIKEPSNDKTISLQEPIPIPWKNGATLYEENEMTDYSLARYLETKISNELVKIDQITRIETNRNKNDLIFKIHAIKGK